MQITKQRLKQLIMEEQQKIVIESRIRELKPNVLDTLLNEAIRILLSEGRLAHKLKKAALILGVPLMALTSALAPATVGAGEPGAEDTATDVAPSASQEEFLQNLDDGVISAETVRALTQLLQDKGPEVPAGQFAGPFGGAGRADLPAELGVTPEEFKADYFADTNAPPEHHGSKDYAGQPASSTEPEAEAYLPPKQPRSRTRESKQITQHDLKRLIHEELQNEGMFGDAAKKMKSIGAALAKKMAGAKALEPYFAKLAEQDDFQKAQFVSLIANKIGLDLTTAASKLKATQKTVGGAEEPVPEEPQVA